MARPTSKHYVGWQEEYVSNDRGSRVVHYYLKDRHGKAKLAVVGTERSLRHMVYVVSEEFLHLTNNSKSNSSSSMKWRSRREVVDWLDSLLSKPRPTSSGDHNTNITSSYYFPFQIYVYMVPEISVSAKHIFVLGSPTDVLFLVFLCFFS